MNLEHLVEGAKIVDLLSPAADAAGRNGDGVSLKNYRRAIIVCSINQGAANTVLLTPQECTAVAGTGAKALTKNCQIWVNQDCATNDTLARQTDAKNFTTSAATTRKQIVFVIDAAALDQANSFDCVRVTTGASAAGNITAATAYLVGPRYAQDTPPSARVD